MGWGDYLEEEQPVQYTQAAENAVERMQQTHSPDCWRIHPECCRSRMERLEKEIASIEGNKGHYLNTEFCDGEETAWQDVKRIMEGLE